MDLGTKAILEGLRGAKGTDYEGGVRVPFLASWKGHFPKGKVVDEFISNMDVLPTVAALCGATISSGHIDGVNIENIVMGAGSIDRDVLLYTSGMDLNIHCARLGDWKLRFAEYNSPPYVNIGRPRVSCTLAHPELYHLKEDPAKSYDVAAEYPKMVATIMKLAEVKIQTFPDGVRAAYSKQKLLVGSPKTEAGAWPRVPQA